MQPLVTVNILSYNRKADLQNTLKNVFDQEYKNIEVIVVDNDSSDGSVEMVKSEYPAVRVLELQRNVGIAGWNEGAKIAKGEYLLLLDDDSYPEKRMLQSTIPICHKNKIIALDVRDPNEKYMAHHNLQIIPTFVGCGVIIPREMFYALNGYESFLFLYAHEEEFSMRALQLGFTLQFVPGKIVYHRRSPKNRVLNKNNSIDKRKIYFKNRNSIVLLLLHFPLATSLPRIFRLCLGRILFALLNKCFLTVLTSIFDGLRMSMKYWDKRIILDAEVQQKYGYGKSIGSFFAGGDVGFQRPPWL